MHHFFALVLTNATDIFFISLNILEMPQSHEFCKRLVYWGQYGPTCWFNALLMATLYSQRSRNVLLRSIETLDDNIKIYKIFKHILKYKYIKSKKPEKDTKFFADIKPEKILTMLNQYNSKRFMLTDFNKGFNADLYIKKFYKIFNADTMMILRRKHNVFYDVANHIASVAQIPNSNNYSFTYKIKPKLYVLNQLMRTPDILIIRAQDNIDDDISKNHIISHQENIKNIRSDDDVITYNNTEYELDSVIMSNWNIMDNNHSICGLTCQNERYVYNGWTINTNDAAMKKKVQNRKLPCELMKFDWNIKKDAPFCLNAKQCKLDLVYDDDIPKDLCFSFSKGYRTLIYVKKNAGINENSLSKTPAYMSFSSSKRKQVKDCENGKIRDPVTKRCISMKTALQRGLIADLPKAATPTAAPTAAPPALKPCKDNKIRDARTGRCVSLQTAKKRGILA